MMSNPHSSDYHNQYSMYKCLDEIDGKPSSDGIITIFRQLKYNSQCLPTHLSGGHLGYLALILRGTEYLELMNSQPFNQSTDLGISTHHAPPALRYTNYSCTNFP